MKQYNLIFIGLFLISVYFKMTQLGPVPQGPPIAWWEVFAPLVIGVFGDLVWRVAKLFGLGQWVEFWIWKIILKFKVRSAGQKARKAIKDWGKKGGNPGQFKDPLKTGSDL